MKKLILIIIAVFISGCSQKVDDENIKEHFINTKNEILSSSYYYFETGTNRGIIFQTELIVSGDNKYARVETSEYKIEMYELDSGIYFFENGIKTSEGDLMMIVNIEEHVISSLDNLENNYFNMDMDIILEETDAKYIVSGDYKVLGSFEINIYKKIKEIMFFENDFKDSLDYVIQTMILKEYDEEITLPE